MKAALFQPGGRFEITDRPDPVPGPGEAVVEAAFCGICGSDLHLVDRKMLPPGAIIGHELSGKIAAIGPDVHGWEIGEPVAVMPLDPCLTCTFCRSGNTQRCADGLKRSYGLGLNPGGFAQFMRVKTTMLYRLPPGLDLQTAALAEPWAVARHALNMLALSSQAVVHILGAGPIGLFCVFGLRLKGITTISVSEPDPSRIERAREAGASLVIDPKSQKPLSAIVHHAGQPPDIVIDCAGTESSTAEAVSLVRSGGTVLMLGIHMGKIGLLPLVCFGKEVTIKFSFGYTAAEFGESLGELGRGAVRPENIISEIFPLTSLSAAFEKLHHPGPVKILIACQEL